MRYIFMFIQQENRLVVAPAKKRLAARELALKQPVGDTGVGVFQVRVKG